jgi:hypothetical protein
MKPDLILYDLSLNQECHIYDIACAEWAVQFKIILPPILRDQWYELASKLNSISLNVCRDEVKWIWSPNLKFSVQSMYNQLNRSDESGPSFKYNWRAKVPQKIKIFMWLVAQGAILTKTKDNMIRKKGQDSPA